MTIKKHFEKEVNFTKALQNNSEWAAKLFVSCGISIGAHRAVAEHPITPQRRLDNAWYTAEDKCLVIAESQIGRVDYDHMQKALDYASFANCKESILICESVTEDAIRIFSGWPKANLHLYLVVVTFGDNAEPLWKLEATNNPQGNAPTKWIEKETFNYGDDRIISSLSDGIPLLELLKNLSGLGIPEEFNEATRQRVFASHISDIRMGEIQTPRPLIEEILTKIPEEYFESTNSTFFDPACGSGTFLVAIKERLLAKGHSEKNALKRIYGMDKVVDNAILTALKLGSATNIFADDTLTTEEVRNMKFDVIIGNPPYQRPKTDKETMPFWPRFVRFAWERTTETGVIGMVTPNTWMKPTQDLRKASEGGPLFIMKDYFAKSNVTHVSCERKLKEEYFKGVGSSFSWYVFRKGSVNKNTTFATDDGEEVKVDFGKIKVLPNKPTKMSLEIFKKLQSLQNNFSYSLNQQVDKKLAYQDSADAEFKYPYVSRLFNKSFNPAYGCNIVYYAQKHVDFDRPKIVVNYQGELHPYVDDGNVGLQECLCQHLESIEQVPFARSIVNSKIMRFAYQYLIFGAQTEAVLLNGLTHPGFTKEYSDDELFKLYGLSDEEIAYINKILGE